MGHHPGGTLGPDILLFDYDGAGNVTYAGIAHPGQVSSEEAWQIRKLAYDGAGNVLSVLYADGNKKFDNIWDNRVGYTYS
jgi:YD repeat-containing protein